MRGHSNVQGQRTVGISEKPKLVPLDKLAEQFGFEPPREQGRTTVEAVEGVLDGSVKGFVSLGGNFARAIPDQDRTDPAWANLALNVQIATKLNRSHLLVGKATWLLPCLVRAEEDLQATGPQAVTMEDSLSHVHGSIGKREPASPELKSELAIVAGMAKATLAPNPKVRWDDWTGNYALVRDLIAETYPDDFRDFDARKFTPGGFYRGNAARERRWETDSGKAVFTTPTTLSALGAPLGENEYTLVTLRSNDQFNTTVYGYSDRLRGLEGPREIVLMNPAEIERAGFVAGQRIAIETASGDGRTRRVTGFAVQPYDLPDGCVGAYYPRDQRARPARGARPEVEDTGLQGHARQADRLTPRPEPTRAIRRRTLAAAVSSLGRTHGSSLRITTSRASTSASRPSPKRTAKCPCARSSSTSSVLSSTRASTGRAADRYS